MTAKVCPSPKEARAIPPAMTKRERKRFVEKRSVPSKSPQIMVKTGAPPLRIVPKETVRILRAMLEKPISRAVAIAMGRTWSRNCLLDRGSGRYFGWRDHR